MKKAKILAALCSAAVLIGTNAFPVNAIMYDVGENTSFLQILDEMQTNENGYLFHRTTGHCGYYEYLTEDGFDFICVVSECYTIYLDDGSDLPDNAVSNLQNTFKTKSNGMEILITEGEPVIFNAEVSGISLQKIDDGVYQLWFSDYEINEDALVAYLQTIPSFSKLTLELSGYVKTDIPEIMTYSSANASVMDSSQGNVFTVRVTDNRELSLDDFDNLLDIDSIIQNPYTPTEYKLRFDTETYESFTCSELLQMVRVLQSMDIIDPNSIEICTFTIELYYNPEDYLLDTVPETIFTRDEKETTTTPQETTTETNTTTTTANAIMTTDTSTDKLARGDFDGDGKITIQDAYNTLLAYSKHSAGKDSELTDEQLTALDIDNNGKVEITDAYYILLYYSYQSAGLKPQWSELLTESEKDTPSVATGTTELTDTEAEETV